MTTTGPTNKNFRYSNTHVPYSDTTDADCAYMYANAASAQRVQC